MSGSSDDAPPAGCPHLAGARVAPPPDGLAVDLGSGEPRLAAKEAVAFEVLDALEGLCSLERRSPTLEGSVPLRVAQGCVPLLEGNAFGWQIVLRPRLHVVRRLGRTRLALDGEAAVRERVAGAIPRLVAHGLVSAAMGQSLRALMWARRGWITLWTGLLVRPVDACGLRVAQAANRRNRLLEVAPGWLEGPQLVPLLVSFRVRGGSARVQGELACLGVHPARAQVRTLALAEAPELGVRHRAFFDEAYFTAKRSHITGRYRREIARLPTAPPLAGALLEAVCVAPSRLRAIVCGGQGPAGMEVANEVSFRARFDGYSLEVEPERLALELAARRVEQAWEATYGAGAVERDRRALWYLTKYFTPHPPGEPHFFVKPWAFVRTPPGWSTLIEGICGDTYDILRGVVATDVFHAVPAVFALQGAPCTLSIPAGQPLAQLFPVARWTLDATWRRLQWEDFP